MIKINDKTVVILNDKDEELIEQQFYADEFIWIIKSKEPIILNRENNETFYDELDKIMDSEYVFQEGIPSFKTKHKLVWLSDQYCDLEDIESLSKVNRLVIEKNNDSFIIRVENPMLEKLKIKKRTNIIAFSPSYNGFFSQNVKTKTTFQDDIVHMFQKILNDKSRILK